LTAYFISNISAKKTSKSIHVCQSYSKPKVGRFLRHGVKLYILIFLEENFCCNNARTSGLKFAKLKAKPSPR